ncbi:MDR family MFS transporter [Streptomyces candidus]|uniref:MFS family permease n=1 Tax=Streptomyces candidus TaxID=67283 RepID=A0A7X0HDQ6_9ACTN|nr:MFS transporter [Streptomyces candidus]MBB6435678.1 MFS family permease [Streptomyces candidus]GHH46555.1 MFS transporter [Streptomyces candidus]
MRGRATDRRGQSTAPGRDGSPTAPGPDAPQAPRGPDGAQGAPGPDGSQGALRPDRSPGAPDTAAGARPARPPQAERRPDKAAVAASRWRALTEIRALPSYLRLLVGTQLAFNVGFFAVLPYLAQHLGTGLGMAGWTVGLVLGLRTFSQQGLFVVGGALTDRFGPRPVVLAGCVLRIAGFVWLAFAGSTGTVVAAVLLIGFAAALFSPAVESETAREAVRFEQEDGTPRTQVLAVFSAAGQAGAFVGPLLGSLLLFSGFRAACLAGAAVFVAVLAGHWRLMPARPAAHARERRGGGVRALVRSPGFVLVCLAYSCYLVAYNQLYLSLPAEVERTTGSQAALGWLFALSSLLVVCVQLPVTRWAGRRLGLRTALVAGLLVVAAGFLGVAVCVPLHLGGAAGLLPGAFLVVAITLGQMLLVPAARALVPDLVDDRHLGLAMGALSSVSGLVVLVGSAATGALLGEGGLLLWGGLASVPLAGALLAGCLRRDGRAAG